MTLAIPYDPKGGIQGGVIIVPSKFYSFISGEEFKSCVLQV